MTRMNSCLAGLLSLALLAIAAAPATSQVESRLALVIGNADYPDADAPLQDVIASTRSLADDLRRMAFDVALGENLTRARFEAALQQLYGRIKPGATALIVFSGYGLQSGRQSYLLPVDARIWSEHDVGRDGFNLESILAEMNARGARAQIAIVDASRRNPFERRFRSVAAGLAPVSVPGDTAVMYAAAPGAVVSDGNSTLFMTELRKELRTAGNIEEFFSRTRVNVSRQSRGEQTPWFSSSLTVEVSFGSRSSSPPPVAVPPPAAAPADPDAAARREFEAAQRIGTRKAWEDFLARYSSGSYSDLARDQLARLAPPAVAAKPEPSVAEIPPGTARVDDPAIRELDRRIAQNPSDAAAYYRRGQLYAQQGDFQRAAQDFDQVLRLNPRDAEAFNNRCWTRAMLGQLQAALADCDQALRLNPRNVDAFDSRGFVNLRLGRAQQALADYDSALRLAPRLASSLYGRGIARLRSGDVAGGNRDIAAAQGLQPDIAQEFAAYGIGATATDLPSAPASSGDASVTRYPTIEAPDRVAAGASTIVVVSLTTDKVTPTVVVRQTGKGAAKTSDGGLSIQMPEQPPRTRLHVVLRAAGFEFDPSTPEEATIELDREGDSTSARFDLRARPDAAGESSLRVTFWKDNEFLASASRKIEIAPAAMVQQGVARETRSDQGGASPAAAPRASELAAPPPRARMDSALAIPARPRPIDLKIEIAYENPRNLGRGRVTIASNYLGTMRHGEVDHSHDLVQWLEAFYREFKLFGTDPALSAAESRERSIGRLRSFGEELYRRAAPPVLKAALAELLANPAVELRTVQVYSNNPVIPWELMRAPMPGGRSTDFFGIAFAFARWHEDEGPQLTLRPPQDREIGQVVAVVPSYSGPYALPAQARELEELRRLLDARQLSGKRASFLGLVRDPASGIVHFAGHGEVAGPTAAERRYALHLEDGAVDVMDWRGAPTGNESARALYFFNACEIGQAESTAGAVEGWAPAVLARGAAGYIGGLWPLRDDPAAQFAVRFYSAVAERLAKEGRASVADALADARRLVYETGDPTYLAYAFYGDAQLALVRSPAQGSR